MLVLEGFIVSLKKLITWLLRVAYLDDANQNSSHISDLTFTGLKTGLGKSRQCLENVFQDEDVFVIDGPRTNR